MQQLKLVQQLCFLELVGKFISCYPESDVGSKFYFIPALDFFKIAAGYPDRGHGKICTLPKSVWEKNQILNGCH